MFRKSLSIVLLAAAVSAGSGFAHAQSAPAAPRVLVIPFTTLNVPDRQQWIARGVQENLVADLGRSGGFNPVAFQGQLVVEDNATAARLARQASAHYAVRGAAQVVGDTVRLTAQLIDARNGDTLSTAAVTGSPNDLLRLEDELAAQLRGGPAAAAANMPEPPAAPTPQAPAEPAPQIVVVSQPSSPALGYDPYYSSSYMNSGLYGYPGVIWPITVPVYGGHHHHHHDHDCDHPPTQPPPVVHPGPQPPLNYPHNPLAGGGGFSLPTPTGGFSLPTPQGSGFANNTPTGGFSLPVPQTAAPAVRWSSVSAQSWHTPQFLPQAPKAPTTARPFNRPNSITIQQPVSAPRPAAVQRPVVSSPRPITFQQPVSAPRPMVIQQPAPTLRAPQAAPAPRSVGRPAPGGRTLQWTQYR